MRNELQKFSFVETGPRKGDIENEDENFVFNLVDDYGISEEIPERFDAPYPWIDVIRYDVYNEDFAGHLNIHFNGGGNWSYSEQRNGKKGEYYVKTKTNSIKSITNNPLRDLKGTILAIAKRVAGLHERNIKESLSNGSWTRIAKPLSPKRRPVS